MSKREINQEGFAHLLLIIAGLIIFGTASASVIPNVQEFPKQNNQSVLGEDEEIKEVEEKIENEVKEAEKKIKEEIKEEEKKFREGEKKLEEVKKEEIKSVKELEKQEKQKILELQKLNRFSAPPSASKAKIQSAFGSGKSETEIETADGQKIKTKIEDDGRVKIEIENRKLKIKFENGKFRVEHEGSGSGELDDEDIDELEDEIEQEFEDEGIEIASSSGGLLIKKNKRKALTRFPLSINPETNELVVTTPAGQKTVTVLPDQAVENMLSNSVLSGIDEDGGEENIEIEERNDELVYKVKGEKDHKFLGFIPLKTAITAFVSAQTGELTAQEQSLLSRIISQLSF